MSYYNRKSPRIPNYDYSTQNCYFITICTHNRRCILGDGYCLSKIGRIVEEHIQQISSHYQDVSVEKYVVMPNHIHMLLALNCNGRYDTNQIIGQYKSGVSREVGKLYPNVEVWQRSFHDHVIRNQFRYEKIWHYIEDNPRKWEEDCFYMAAEQVEKFRESH